MDDIHLENIQISFKHQVNITLLGYGYANSKIYKRSIASFETSYGGVQLCVVILSLKYHKWPHLMLTQMSVIISQLEHTYMQQFLNGMLQVVLMAYIQIHPKHVVSLLLHVNEFSPRLCSKLCWNINSIYRQVNIECNTCWGASLSYCVGHRTYNSALKGWNFILIGQPMQANVLRINFNKLQLAQRCGILVCY